MRHLRLIVPVERMVCVGDDELKCDPHCVNHIGAVIADNVRAIRRAVEKRL
jgi:hypothetical protein